MTTEISVMYGSEKVKDYFLICHWFSPSATPAQHCTSIGLAGVHVPLTELMSGGHETLAQHWANIGLPPRVSQGLSPVKTDKK